MSVETTWKRLRPVALEDPVLDAIEDALSQPEVLSELAGCEARELYPADLLAHLRRLGLSSLLAEVEGEPSRVTMWHAASLNAMTARVSGSLAITLGVNLLALLPVYIAADDSQRRRFFDRVRGGDLAALLLTEWACGSDLKSIQTRAHAEGGGYRLTGEKHLINGGTHARLLVTLARTGESRGDGGPFGAPADLGLFVVERDETCLALPRYRTVPAPAADISAVRFADTRVGAENLLGGAADGFSIIQQTLAVSRGGVAALAAGAANRASELASGYARRRYLYGAPIASLGAVSEHLVRLAALDHLCTALALQAAAWVNTLGQGAGYLTAVAKLACCSLAEEAVDEGRRVLSARALVGDLPYSRLLRDVLLYGVFDGTRHIMLEHVERRLSQMASRAREEPAPDPASLHSAQPARLCEVAGRRKRPLVPSIAARLEALAGQSGSEHLEPVARTARALLDLVTALRRGGRWDEDQALRFEAAEILCGLEAIAALAELGDPAEAVSRYATGWYGARVAGGVVRLAARTGESEGGAGDAERRLCRLSEAARAPLRQEIEHG